MIKDVLSQVFRKPSKAQQEDLAATGWIKAQQEVITLLEHDPTIKKKLSPVLIKFKKSNDDLKLIQSVKNVKIYYMKDLAGNATHARCFFPVEGKPREFRKALSGGEAQQDLIKYFTDQLREYLMEVNNARTIKWCSPIPEQHDTIPESSLSLKQLEVNEIFFAAVLQALGEGGIYEAPSLQEMFVIHEGKFAGKAIALEKISKIVSQEFFQEHFKLLD